MSPKTKVNLKSELHIKDKIINKSNFMSEGPSGIQSKIQKRFPCNSIFFFLNSKIYLFLYLYNFKSVSDKILQ